MPLANDDLIALLRKEEEAASGYQDAALSAIREEALAYYDRQPYGDEQEGASSIVTSEFADVVESLMPGLMRVFTGSDDLAKFAPMAPGQEKWAKEASEYVPHVLMRQNDGFRVISALLKDALMYRLSGATVDLEDVEDKRTVPVHNLTQDAVDLIVAEAQAQGAELVMDLAGDPSGAAQPAIEGVAPDMLASPSQTFSGTITVTHKRKRVVVDSIAPEDIRFSPVARDEDKASFLGFIKRVTSSDLVKLGLTQEEIDDLSADKGLSDEAAQRNEGVLDDAERAGALGNGEADSERPLWLVVAYIRADDDGDGISELRRVVYLAPYQSEAHLLLGRLYLRNGRLEEAADAFKISIWSEDSLPAHLALADAYVALKNPEAARSELQLVLRRDGANADARRLLETLGAP
jgi:hypothetical protein